MPDKEIHPLIEELRDQMARGRAVDVAFAEATIADLENGDVASAIQGLRGWCTAIRDLDRQLP